MSFSRELEFVHENAFPLKKHRHRACDVCRHMKRRCDGNPTCSHCLSYGVPCTYVQPSVPRPRHPRKSLDPKQFLTPKDQDHVARLKQRLNDAEAALGELERGETSKLIWIDPAVNWIANPFTPHPDDAAFVDIVKSFQSLSLDSTHADPGFRGRSSTAMLVKAAMSVKPSQPHKSPAAYTPRTSNRPENLSVVPHRLQAFPSDPLMMSLISQYFANLNLLLPLLRRPLFLECIRQQLHLRHNGFAAVLLLVCALGSLYLTDVPTEDRRRLAWKWYDEVELCGHSLRQQPTYYDLQAYCLATTFLHFTSNPRFAWSVAGFGLRFAEDLGAHRQKPTANTTKEELEKRTMWILLMLDIYISDPLGRPRALNRYDLDIVLPSDCDDDEYWELWGPGRQLKDRPWTMSFFNNLVGLTRIVHITHNALYCNVVDRHAAETVDPKATIKQLDSALNTWFSQIPQHLAWDLALPDVLLGDQSAIFACIYYHARILIHRSTLTAVPIVPLDALARKMCTEAARACIGIADAQRRCRPDHPLLFSQNPVFTAGMALVVDLAGNTDNVRDPAPDLALIRTAIDVLRSQQQRWPSSEFYVTVLEGLLSTITTSAEVPHPPVGTHYSSVPTQIPLLVESQMPAKEQSPPQDILPSDFGRRI
ncbi:fungal-specific transcription factor domain-containing protein [Mycena galopus ATCC 62051]|nr:fungal-specific transcription factor domain-containing protein [Mycena galopus ATCC 62051]